MSLVWSLWNRWRNRIWTASLIGTWLSVLINWTIRDSNANLAFIFYATPPVVIGVLSLLLIWVGRKVIEPPSGPFHLSMHRATIALALICLIQWIFGDFRLGVSRQQPQNSLKVAFWNVGRGHFASWQRIADRVRTFEADIVILSEATDEPVQSPEFWQAAMPEYFVLPLRNGMLLLVKGQAREVCGGKLALVGDARHLSVAVRGIQFDIVLADLPSNPIRSRAPPLRRLFEILRQRTIVPTLVVGDFNTPPSSIYFDDWRTEWTRAWEVAGTGYQPTWPQPFPVLTLDQIWGNSGIDFHECHCEWSSCSDHRPVVVTLTVKEDRRQEGED